MNSGIASKEIGEEKIMGIAKLAVKTHEKVENLCETTNAFQRKVYQKPSMFIDFIRLYVHFYDIKLNKLNLKKKTL